MQQYNRLNEYLKNKLGGRTLKICIDGGFTCPNRDGKCGVGGCIFCGEKGSGENTKNGAIQAQVKNHLASYRGKRAEKFVAYFQNFTNSYAPINILKTRYDEALCDKKIVALAIATRPDCINQQVVNLLKTYKDTGLYVWVELGLQTVNEEVGKIINRGYTNQDFVDAVNLLNAGGIDVCTHIMIGLPGEKEKDIDDIINFVNQQKICGIKLHSTYVIRNTKLTQMYENGQYSPIEKEEYINKVIYILTRLRPDIVIHRITGDAPKDLLIAPSWSTHKKLVLNAVDNIMKNNNLYQGMFYKNLSAIRF